MNKTITSSRAPAGNSTSTNRDVIGQKFMYQMRLFRKPSSSNKRQIVGGYVVQNKLSLLTAVHLGHWSCKHQEFVQSHSESAYK